MLTMSHTSIQSSFLLLTFLAIICERTSDNNMPINLDCTFCECVTIKYSHTYKIEKHKSNIYHIHSSIFNLHLRWRNVAYVYNIIKCNATPSRRSTETIYSRLSNSVFTTYSALSIRIIKSCKKLSADPSPSSLLKQDERRCYILHCSRNISPSIHSLPCFLPQLGSTTLHPLHSSVASDMIVSGTDHRFPHPILVTKALPASTTSWTHTHLISSSEDTHCQNVPSSILNSYFSFVWVAKCIRFIS